MKTAKQWVDENSSSGPFDNVHSCVHAEQLVKEIQQDAIASVLPPSDGGTIPDGKQAWGYMMPEDELVRRMAEELSEFTSIPIEKLRESARQIIRDRGITLKTSFGEVNLLPHTHELTFLNADSK